MRAIILCGMSVLLSLFYPAAGFAAPSPQEIQEEVTDQLLQSQEAGWLESSAAHLGFSSYVEDLLQAKSREGDEKIIQAGTDLENFRWKENTKNVKTNLKEQVENYYRVLRNLVKLLAQRGLAVAEEKKIVLEPLNELQAVALVRGISIFADKKLFSSWTASEIILSFNELKEELKEVPEKGLWESKRTPSKFNKIKNKSKRIEEWLE